MEPHKPHVVLVASPGLGHLIPVIELGKRFAFHHNFKVTILAVTSNTSNAEAQVLKSTTAPCDLIEIPAPNISGIVDGANASLLIQLCVMMREAKAAIRSILSNMSVRPSALIVDLFGTYALSMAQELNILSYAYVASHAWYLSLLLFSPVLDQQIEGQYVDQNEPLKIPGCNPIPPEDAVDLMLDRSKLEYKECLLGFANEILKADGILVNTWEEIQRKELESLKEGDLKKIMKVVPDIYAVGPLVRQQESETSQLTESLVKWLDEQPDDSVIYVSFGSGGTVSYEQMIELAWGLELSEQRFIWVVRAPMEGLPHAAYFTSGSGATDEIWKHFPEGFMHRTRGMGLLVPQWAPQVTILRHRSVGGFLTHCGWGSMLESITSGVPMIAWPLYAEQRMNAALSTEELGVAVRPTVLPTKKVVDREEIARMVRDIIGGDKNKKSKIRERVKQIQRSAVAAFSEGGSSYIALSQIANVIQGSRKG